MTVINIQFSPPDISADEINEVVDTLKSGWITTGPKTKLLEKQIAHYCGVPAAVGVNSATAGLELVLRLFGIGEGDEVITSAYTYTASASVIYHVGAKIVLADTSRGSYEMDYENLAGLINERTKAIIPVDYAGVICDYDAILKAVDGKRALFKPCNPMQEKLGRVLILGDAAHSFGSVRNNTMSGNHADFSVFSFHAVKNFTTAEGGAITWKATVFDNDDVYRQFMLFSLHGQTKDALSKLKAGAWEYDIVAPYYKCNMTDIMASIGIAQLRRYSGLLARRTELVALYDEMLDGSGICALRHSGAGFDSCKHLYVVRLSGRGEAFRNSCIEKMGERGVATNVHFKPLPLLTAYKNLGFDIKNYPNAFGQYANSISLPLHTSLSDDDIRYIAEALKEIVNM